MQIVIDIPEDEYKICLSHRESIENMIRVHKCFSLEYAVVRGTPLPKGHDRLIDMKNLQNFVSQYTEHDAVQLILADREDYIPTIIEADRSEKE